MKLNTNSNTYTIVYASGVVIVVAFLLAFFSSVLKPASDANERIDRKKQILASLNIEVPKDEVESTYSATVKSDPIVDANGSLQAQSGGFDVERKEIKSDRLPFFVCNVNGQTKYVFPLVGKGLWGTIWGYLALNDDCKTVYGAYFSHESETAGLGALISSNDFQSEFKGKKIEDASGNILSVVKHGAKQEHPELQCDGISGATLTVNGVTAMLHEYVAMYRNYLMKLKK